MPSAREAPELEPGLRRLVGATAIVAPGLHVASDVVEWLDGFSPAQLVASYLAFLPLPALFVGLYAVQRPRIARTGLLGALVYGAAFVYFAFTALYALHEPVWDYAQLLGRLGTLYTLHGAAMVVGGAMFGVASLRAAVLPRWAVALFLIGLALSVAVAVIPSPPMLQTAGSAVRNIGLAGMGLGLLRAPTPGVTR